MILVSRNIEYRVRLKMTQHLIYDNSVTLENFCAKCYVFV